MKTTTHLSLLACATLIALAISPAAHADVFMDQIGNDPTVFTGGNSSASENFSDDANFSAAVVDDFNLAAPVTVTNVSAALLGFGTFTSYSQITGYEVNIYSSLAAATSNLTGDVFHEFITSADASLTTPYSGDSESALVSLNVDVPLNLGTYYVSVQADGSFAGDGEVGVYDTTGLPGSNPGGTNASQVNPGGGFGFSGNASGLNGDAAYKVSGTTAPEPTTWAMMGVGLLSLLALGRFRRTA